MHYKYPEPGVQSRDMPWELIDALWRERQEACDGRREDAEVAGTAATTSSK